MIIALLLVGFIPAILLVEVGRSRRPVQEQPESYAAWVNFLSLGLVLVGMAALLALALLGDSGSVIVLVLLPALCTLIAEGFQFLFTVLARLVSRQELPGLARPALQFLLALGLLLALGVWGDWFYILAGVFGGTIVLIGQWMGGTKGGRLALVYLLLVGLLLLAVWRADTYRDYSTVSSTLDVLARSLLVVAPGLGMVFASTILRRALEGVEPGVGRRLLHAGLLVIPVLLLIAWQAATLSAWDVATDGLGGIFLLQLVYVIGAAAVTRQGWRLPTRRTPVLWGFALVLLFVISGANAFGTFGLDGEWGNVPRMRTARRAESISRAILAYHEEQGRYPQALSDLWPRYLLYVPTPFIIPGQDWCYQGGADYYRLGYVSRDYFSSPAFVKMHASVGQPPDPAWSCDGEAERYPGP